MVQVGRQEEIILRKIVLVQLVVRRLQVSEALVTVLTIVLEQQKQILMMVLLGQQHLPWL